MHRRRSRPDQCAGTIFAYIGKVVTQFMHITCNVKKVIKMNNQHHSYDESFEEDEYPRKPPAQSGKLTDAEVAQEQADWLFELGGEARSRTLKYLEDADQLDDNPELQEAKINMACKLGGLVAKVVATNGQHNKARRGY